MLESPAVSERRWTAPLAEQWYGLRNRLMTSQKFQYWAAKLPVSRLIARHAASDAFDLVAGFVYSQVLLACVQLRLFDHLRSGARTLPDLARRMDLKPDAAERLLRAAQSLKLVTHIGPDRYCLGSRGAAIAGNPGILSMISHHALLYRDLADPVALLRGEAPETELSRYWSYCGDNPGALTAPEVEEYTQLMSQSQTFVAAQILDAYPFQRHRRILDIGGGEGTFLMAVADRVSSIALTLFDVPPVADRARENFAARGLSARATAVGGDFFKDSLPEGADLVSLVRVAHDHDDDAVMSLLRRIRAGMDDDATLLIAEPLAGAASGATVGDAYFGFYLLAMGRGRARTARELTDMLIAAGFADVREHSTAIPLQCGLLTTQIDSKKRKANLTSKSVGLK